LISFAIHLNHWGMLIKHTLPFLTSIIYKTRPLFLLGFQSFMHDSQLGLLDVEIVVIFVVVAG
jgi:hypothetical protein